MINKKTLVFLSSFILPISNSSADELLSNGAFIRGMNDWWGWGGAVQAKNNQACMGITNPGSSSWSVVIAHANITLEEGETYQISFDAYADVETQFKTLIQHNGSPYTHYFSTQTIISPSKKSYNYNFTHKKSSDTRAQFQFQMGGQKEANICVSNVSIQDKGNNKLTQNSPVRLNQLGFYPSADKFAFVASESLEPIPWTMNNSQGTPIDSGLTTVFGLNSASGENLHTINLSTLTTEQKGLTIDVAEATTTPFDINSHLYEKLKYDAFAYFYQNRSGIEILDRYVQRPNLARPAGHPIDKVTCFNKEDTWGNKWPGCDFEMDVTGGWYDAGDHGKYTVNSGITTWTLLNLYERGKWVKGATIPLTEALIPESDNGVNPVLSEARWNIEFMLAMQIPEGKLISVPEGNQSLNKTFNLTEIDASNLAFHKIANDVWTAMPLSPDKDHKTRYVGQASTAATLNLAAIAAQCARIWKGIDSEFSEKCLHSAENAWQAAQQYPDIYAYNNFTGSGAYSDFSLTDEFYWAAAELFITTGKDEYRTYIQNSKHYLETPYGIIAWGSDMYWKYTAPLGTISLAVVPNDLDVTEINLAQKTIIQTAKNYQLQMSNEGYRIPYTVNKYAWGSNSHLVNRSIFLIYANDFTGDINYLKTVASTMDYLLGGNPMDMSYITGYGVKSAQNPHHRFWAHSLNENFPAPAPGALVGGPNSTNFSDSIAAALKDSCTGQTCYSDNIRAWSFNEITINWNAPLVWVASALDEGKLD